MTLARTGVVISVLAALAQTAAAQRPASPEPAAQPPVAQPILAGVIAGAVGFFGGARAGYAFDCADGCPGDFGGYGGAVIGGLAGEMLLLPIGVHLGNGRRGSLASDLTASILSGGGSLLFVALTDPEAFFVAPVVQLTATVLTERRSAQERAERRLGFGIGPVPGGLAVAGSWRF